MQIDSSLKALPRSYDELFLRRYDSVLKWALYITKHDRELAEDLVHEVYVYFTITQQDSSEITSIDDYLYVALRNSYISYLRRTVRLRQKSLTLIEHDSVDNALLAVDPQHQIQIHEKLLAVCQYACLRKETSISGSILILRFFHGYFPSEVARVLNSSSNVVEARLVTARREAAAFLANPETQTYVKIGGTASHFQNNFIQRHHGVLNDMRDAIFASRQGDCYRPEQIKKFYQREQPRINRVDLSHIVSCRKCLDETNEFLGLPILRERHPLDTIGREYNDGVNSKNEFEGLAKAATSLS